MAWMRDARTGPDARACRKGEPCSFTHLVKRERIEVRRDLALEPRLLAPARVLAGPPAIGAMPPR